MGVERADIVTVVGLNRKAYNKAYNKEYYSLNRERLASYHKKWRQENRERLSASKREYQEKNKGRITAYRKEWYLKNKRRILDEQSEYAKNYRESKRNGNPEWRIKSRVHKFKAKGGDIATLPNNLREMILSNPPCEACGSQINWKLCIDHCHKTGRYRGLICSYCNSALGYIRDNPDTARKLIAYLERASS